MTVKCDEKGTKNIMRWMFTSVIE